MEVSQHVGMKLGHVPFAFFIVCKKTAVLCDSNLKWHTSKR